MAILMKTTSVRVSSIQIMQVRVQNKGKSVWKSRYDVDVSIFVEYVGANMSIQVPLLVIDRRCVSVMST